jgi:hypothetical protein
MNQNQVPFIQRVCSYHYEHRDDVRYGQALFNVLPPEVGQVVAGTSFDPFHTQWKTHMQVVDWVDNHLIFSDDFKIIAVFNNDQILWEATSCTSSSL